MNACNYFEHNVKYFILKIIYNILVEFTPTLNSIDGQCRPTKRGGGQGGTTALGPATSKGPEHAHN